MHEVLVTIDGAELLRYAPHTAGRAPETAEARAAVIHALADAIAALSALPPPCPHRDLLRQVGRRLEALDTPDALITCRDLDLSTGAHLQAIDKAIAFTKAAERYRSH